jgi:hypothetical protein
MFPVKSRIGTRKIRTQSRSPHLEPQGNSRSHLRCASRPIHFINSCVLYVSEKASGDKTRCQSVDTDNCTSRVSTPLIP